MNSEQIKERLLFSSPKKKTDAAILFGAKSISGEIAREAAKLFHKGAFKKIVLTGGQHVRELSVLIALSPNFTGLAQQQLDFTELSDFISKKTEADYMEDILLEKGVPASAIVFKDNKSTNTGQNVANISARLTEFNSLSIITTAYFQRRAIGTIRKDSSLNDKALVFHPVYPFGFTNDNWDKTLIKRLVVLESQRMDKSSPETYVDLHCIDPNITEEINKASSLPDLKP
jgi:hypothetical protein